MMKKREAPLSMKLLLFLLFLTGLALNVLIVLDVQWFNYYLLPRGERPAPPPPGSPPPPDGSQVPELDRLRESIVLVLVPTCDGSGVGNGTGFVVKPGYVATAAHVVGDYYACDSEIRVVDSYGVEHAAVSEGYSDANDLALLKISDTSIPALSLADSRQYQEVSGEVEVVTIGYPLVGTASDYDRAAVSGKGNISRFDTNNNRLVTSGLNVNPGNSGGPVFIRDDWTVVGVASAKMDVTVGEGIGFIIPVNLLKSFFLETTSQSLD